MRRLLVSALLAVAAISVTGCAQAVRKADVVDRMETKGVFLEVTDGTTEAGKVDLVIRLSIKTHLPGYYILESGKSLHGKPGYPFVVTIDGQTVTWREDGQIERTPQYDAKGIRTPEGGDGRRYVLEKRLRLATGVHRFEIDLPEEPYARSVQLALEEREEPYLLELKPVYRRSGWQRPSFLHGLSRLEPFLTGALIRIQT